MASVRAVCEGESAFLSIQAQDFIEDKIVKLVAVERDAFLSIQAQDFIEES